MGARFQRVVSICSLIGAALALAALFAGKANTQDVNWWTANSLAKVRPGDAPPSGTPQAVRVYASRNAFEPFQIVLGLEFRIAVYLYAQDRIWVQRHIRTKEASRPLHRRR